MVYARGLLKYAYLLTSLPSCLLLISCLPPWWSQIAKILGSTSIRHRPHACALNRWSRSWISSRTIPEVMASTRGNIIFLPLHWHHNWCDGVSKHRRLDCLFNRLFRRRSEKASKLRVTFFSEGNELNSPVTGEFPSQRVSKAENIYIWWRHHALDTDRWCVIARFATKEIIRK